jgi:hypothetical protein
LTTDVIIIYNILFLEDVREGRHYIFRRSPLIDREITVTGEGEPLDTL